MSNPDAAFGLKKGDHIRLLKMGPDPMPIPPGATGEVIGFCDYEGLEQVWIKWDHSERGGLNLIPGIDIWEKTCDDSAESLQPGQ